MLKDTPAVISPADGAGTTGSSGKDNPCFSCNACCRHFRVSFYHGELDCQPGGSVPTGMTVPISPFRVCMKGTESGHGRCIALNEDGRCNIYAQRPSVCREFPVFMEDGSINPECLRLRALLGIANAGAAGDLERPRA